jgi:hypothetical protein
MSIAPTLGWTLLSREALKKAEAQLNDKTEGVRDEIGFLALHQAYADRFFPGTSVLHTRLRYVLFVPWMYEKVNQKLGAADARLERLLESEELQLVRRLKASGEKGIIGRDVLPKPSSQPPNMVYWSALCEWGIVKRNRDGSFPGRAELHRAMRFSHRHTQLKDDDKAPIEDIHHFFIRVPDPPKEWHRSDKPLDFVLRESEIRFLKQMLSGVMSPGDVRRASLLARLSEVPMQYASVEDPWDKTILKIADEADRGALERARQTAALAAIGRGIYAALLETDCTKLDKRSIEPFFVENLRGEIIPRYIRDALSLDPSMLGQDSLRLANDPIMQVLLAMQEWLRRGGHEVEDLRELFTGVEASRKRGKAKLARTLGGQARRAEWDGNYNVSPLHYRWPVVKGLLQDLHEATI